MDNSMAMSSLVFSLHSVTRAIQWGCYSADLHLLITDSQHSIHTWRRSSKLMLAFTLVPMAGNHSNIMSLFDSCMHGFAVWLAVDNLIVCVCQFSKSVKSGSRYCPILQACLGFFSLCGRAFIEKKMTLLSQSRAEHVACLSRACVPDLNFSL